MEWVETTGKSVADAKDAALDQLGVDEVDAEFEVVSDVKTGLFGRLKEEARVRARVRPTEPRSKDANNRKGRTRKERPASQTPRRPRQQSSQTEDESEDSAETETVVTEDDSANRQPARRNRSRSSGRKSNAEGEGASQMSDPDVSLDQQGEVAEDFLVGFFRETNVEVTLDRSALVDDDLVLLSVNGENLGHLIGPRGSTLHSLQELTRTVVQRKTGSRSARVVVDISGYREKRRAALEVFATQVAEAVSASGTPQAMEAMNPADRKVVHDTITSIEGVSTSSEGEEPRRWVVVLPSNG